jgi:hypothetical protein
MFENGNYRRRKRRVKPSLKAGEDSEDYEQGNSEEENSDNENEEDSGINVYQKRHISFSFLLLHCLVAYVLQIRHLFL